MSEQTAAVDGVEVIDMPDPAIRIGTTPETLKEMRESGGEALTAWTNASDEARAIINKWTSMKISDRISIFRYMTAVTYGKKDK